MTTKITSVCDGVHLFAISAICLVCCERRVRLPQLLFMQQHDPVSALLFLSFYECLAQNQLASLQTV